MKLKFFGGNFTFRPEKHPNCLIKTSFIISQSLVTNIGV
jgi:hypothetical protein